MVRVIKTKMQSSCTFQCVVYRKTLSGIWELGALVPFPLPSVQLPLGKTNIKKPQFSNDKGEDE